MFTNFFRKNDHSEYKPLLSTGSLIYTTIAYCSIPILAIDKRLQQINLDFEKIEQGFSQHKTICLFKDVMLAQAEPASDYVTQVGRAIQVVCKVKMKTDAAFVFNQNAKKGLRGVEVSNLELLSATITVVPNIKPSYKYNVGETFSCPIPAVEQKSCSLTLNNSDSF